VRQLVAEIEIAAPAQRVWEILTDFAAYRQWNPFMPRLDGEQGTATPRRPANARVARSRPPVREVLHLTADGLSNTEIAEHLIISEGQRQEPTSTGSSPSSTSATASKKPPFSPTNAGAFAPREPPSRG
jgi:uncharacterized protein YndB with AHSA1/START domain